MATPSQLFFKKLILSIINFVKKNWFILILIGLTIVLFCALLKDNIEEPFDTSPGLIPPDATNPYLTEGDIYGIIPYPASVNLYNKQEILDQYNNLDNAPDPKKEFTMTTTIFSLAQVSDDVESVLSTNINTTIITAMAAVPALGGLTAATTEFNKITGNLANGLNITGSLQGVDVQPGVAEAFKTAQGAATDAAQEKAKEMAKARAKVIGAKIKSIVGPLASATAASIKAAVDATKKTFYKALGISTTAKVTEKAGKKLATKVGPSFTRTILKKIGERISKILAVRVLITQGIAVALASTVVGLIPALFVEVASNVCMAVSSIVQVSMAQALMGNPPTCPAGYQRLDANMPQSLQDGLSSVPIVGDILGMIGPNVCATNSCRPGLQEDGGLCYPPCDTGYNGVGPVCWSQTVDTSPSGAGIMKSCPSGWTDIGLICSGPNLTAIGKFNNDSRLICPADRDDVDGLCYGKCPHVDGYKRTTILPRFIRFKDEGKSRSAFNQLEAFTRLITQDPASLRDLYITIAIHQALNLGGLPAYTSPMWLYYIDATPPIYAIDDPVMGVTRFNQYLDYERSYGRFGDFGNLAPTKILNQNQKNYLKWLMMHLEKRYQLMLKIEKTTPPAPNAPYVANPEVPVPPFTELPPVQQPQFIGTYQKCTDLNRNIPPVPKKPAVQARAYVPAVPEQLAVPMVASTTQNANIQVVVPSGQKINLTYTSEYDPLNVYGYPMELVKNGSVVHTRNIYAQSKPTPPFYTLSADNTNSSNYVAWIYYKTFNPGSPAILYRAVIPEQPAVAYQAEVPEVPGYTTVTRVCETLPKPNPLYNATQYATEYAGWLARKNNTPPPNSTPESAIPTWDKVEDIPPEYPSAHVPGMPYLCGGKRGLSYARGAGKPKLDLIPAIPSTPLAEPPLPLTADAFADDSSKFTCNNDYKSTYALQKMCEFYYTAARTHAAEEATTSTGNFQYISKIFKLIVSSERSVDVICEISEKGLTNIVASTTTTTATSSLAAAAAVVVAPVAPMTTHNRRFYFAKIPALCNLAPNTTKPAKLSFIPMACTNASGFAQDINNLSPSDLASLSITPNFIFTPPTV
jgi:hypothetical protein